MNKDDILVGTGPRQGRILGLEEPENTPMLGREGRTIAPEEILDDWGQPPPSDPGGPIDSPNDPFSFPLNPSPIKGLKPLLITFGAVLIILLCYELYDVTLALARIHNFLAATFLVLLALVLLLGIRAVADYLRDPEALEGLDLFRQEAERLRISRDKGRAAPFIEKFRNYYLGKPQAPLLDNCIKKIDDHHDYFDDSEIIAYLERQFLQALDKKAFARISHHCLQTGTTIALSPWAVMDVGLALWRNTILLQEIASIYGVRPSLRNRYRLLKTVAGQMAFVGSTQLLMDSTMDTMTSMGASVPIMASFAQGVGAAIYTARIGITAMQVTRPIAFVAEARPTVSSLVSPTVDEIKVRLLQLGKVSKN